MEEREGGRERGKNGRDDIRVDMGGNRVSLCDNDHLSIILIRMLIHNANLKGDK